MSPVRKICLGDIAVPCFDMNRLCRSSVGYCGWYLLLLVSWFGGSGTDWTGLAGLAIRKYPEIGIWFLASQSPEADFGTMLLFMRSKMPHSIAYLAVLWPARELVSLVFRIRME